MNKVIFIFSLILIFFSGFMNVFASTPTVTIDYIEQSPVIPGEDTEVEVPGFPYQLTFFGTVTHEGHGNLKAIKLTASINDELIYGPEKLNVKEYETTANYEIPWIVERPGEYFLKVAAIHPGGDQGKVGCKAAPAIASAYLKDISLPRGGEKKSVAIVAKETGKNGKVWAKNACAVDYETRTINIVDENLD